MLTFLSHYLFINDRSESVRRRRGQGMRIQRTRRDKNGNRQESYQRENRLAYKRNFSFRYAKGTAQKEQVMAESKHSIAFFLSLLSIIVFLILTTTIRSNCTYSHYCCLLLQLLPHNFLRLIFQDASRTTCSSSCRLHKCREEHTPKQIEQSRCTSGEYALCYSR